MAVAARAHEMREHRGSLGSGNIASPP